MMQYQNFESRIRSLEPGRCLMAILLLAFAMFLPIQEARAEEGATIEDRWDALLADHVRPGVIDGIALNVVDYEAIAADPRWEELLTLLETVEVPEGTQEQIAFWTNVYNIMAIKMVVSEYPVDGIRDIGSRVSIFGMQTVWDMDVGVVAGEMRSLDEIEHEIIRPLGDARIHAAVVCAAVSCPPLRTEAYRAEKLDEQFDDQMRVWLANDDTGARFDGRRTLHLSRIFSWFSEDFETDGRSVLDYVKPYLPEAVRGQLPENTRVRFLSYDWSLNDSKRGE